MKSELRLIKANKTGWAICKVGPKLSAKKRCNIFQTQSEAWKKFTFF
jgi:hypothetical protein